jgi:hypothetical protein
MVSHAGAAPFVPVPVILRNFFVLVVFGERRVVVSVLDWYGIDPRSVVPFPPTRFVAFAAVPDVFAAFAGMSPEARVSHAGAAPFVPVPVIRKNFFVEVVFGPNRVVVSVLDWYGTEPKRVVEFPPTRLVAFVAVPEVFAALFGMSALTRDRNVGARDPPDVGPEKTVFAVCTGNTGVVPVKVGEVNIVALLSFVTLPKPTSVAVTVSKAGVAPFDPVPVIRRNFFVEVVFTTNEVVSAALW